MSNESFMCVFISINSLRFELSGMLKNAEFSCLLYSQGIQK